MISYSLNSFITYLQINQLFLGMYMKLTIYNKAVVKIA